MNINIFLIILIFNLLFFEYFDIIAKKLNIFSLTVYAKKEINRKIPLIGGLYILININLIYFMVNNFTSNINEYNNLFFILIISNLYFLVGYLDDKLNLSPSSKLYLFIIITFIVLYNYDFLIIEKLKFSFISEHINLRILSIYFSLFCIFVFLNALNMFDGINGHSGIYIIFVMLVFYSYTSDFIYLIFNFLIIIFLILNLKNKFFIGNSGIFFLGVLISFNFINLYNQGLIIYADEIAIIMFLPGLDLIRLFFVRISNKKNPFSRDHNHWHHIVSKKFGNYKTLIISSVMFSLPFIISKVINISNFYIIFISSLIYFMAIKFCKKNN